MPKTGAILTIFANTRQDGQGLKKLFKNF